MGAGTVPTDCTLVERVPLRDLRGVGVRWTTRSGSHIDPTCREFRNSDRDGAVHLTSTLPLRDSGGTGPLDGYPARRTKTPPGINLGALGISGCREGGRSDASLCRFSPVATTSSSGPPVGPGGSGRLPRVPDRCSAAARPASRRRPASPRSPEGSNRSPGLSPGRPTTNPASSR